MEVQAMKQTPGVRDPEAVGIGFDEWNLNARTQFDELIEAMVDDLQERKLDLRQRFDALLDDMLREGFKLASERYQCNAYLHGTNPVQMVVTIPIGPEEDDGPQWRFNLTEMIKDQIEGLCSFGRIDPDCRDEALEIKASLMELVELVEKAVKP
jgi:hypothetical protein